MFPHKSLDNTPVLCYYFAIVLVEMCDDLSVKNARTESRHLGTRTVGLRGNRFARRLFLNIKGDKKLSEKEL